mgnify:CR=1 FL=1
MARTILAVFFLAAGLVAASPCPSAPVLSIAANGIYGPHTAISWTPTCDLDSIQLYAGNDSLPKAEKLNPINGKKMETLEQSAG